MAKSDIDKKSGRLTGIARHKQFMDVYIQPVKTNNPPQGGLREKVLEIYHSKGFFEAYSLLRRFPNFGAPKKTAREILETWIAEENSANKGKEKDDDDAR